MRMALKIWILFCGVFASGCFYNEDLPLNQNVWPVEQPHQLMMDGRRLLQLDSTIQANAHPAITSVVVIKDGNLVFESYYGENNRSTLFQMAGVGSALANLAVGKAIDMGLITSVQDSIYKYLPAFEQEFEDFPLKKNITFEHLMAMKSGLSWNELTSVFDGQQNDIDKMIQSADWAEYLIKQPLDALPGSRFTHNSSIPILVAEIIEQQYGDGYHNFLINEVFSPLKVLDSDISISGGNLNAAWGVSMTTLDMAKIGYLFMKEGDWFGQSLVSGEYVNASTSVQTTVDFFNDFGWLWWRYSDSSNFLNSLENNDVFFSTGHQGQRLYVIPHLDLVVAMTGSEQPGDFALTAPFALRDYILESIQ